jgi:hypothetical protein
MIDLEASPHARAVVVGELPGARAAGQSRRSAMHHSQRPSSSSSGTVSSRQRQHFGCVSSSLRTGRPHWWSHPSRRISADRGVRLEQPPARRDLPASERSSAASTTGVIPPQVGDAQPPCHAYAASCPGLSHHLPGVVTGGRSLGRGGRCVCPARPTPCRWHVASCGAVARMDEATPNLGLRVQALSRSVHDTLVLLAMRSH